MEKADVKLMQTGQPDIVAADVEVIDPRTITGTFDLTNKSGGRWNVVVINGDGLQVNKEEMVEILVNS